MLLPMPPRNWVSYSLPARNNSTRSDRSYWISTALRRRLVATTFSRERATVVCVKTTPSRDVKKPPLTIAETNSSYTTFIRLFSRFIAPFISPRFFEIFISYSPALEPLLSRRYIFSFFYSVLFVSM